MKLRRAKFKNFRLLRDLEVDFSTDDERRLTVIRAENETGKTTMLLALQWALYGERALPEEGRKFRIHPINWHDADGKRVPIEVEVDFELSRLVHGRKVSRVYRIVRAAREEVDGNDWHRTAPTVNLFQLTEIGAEPIPNPDAFITEELPSELREVFFTDGDRALSFIEADVDTSTKRGRVQRAIKSLLGLGVIEDCIKHVDQAAKEVNRKIREVSSNTELERLSQAIDEADREIEGHQQTEETAREQYEAFDLSLSDIRKQIEAVLKRGDREELGRELETVNQRIQKLSDLSKQLEKRHSAILKSKHLATGLLGPFIESAEKKLSVLNKEGIIPSGTIPVLENCLQKKVCVCGESLGEDDPNGSQKRKHIEHLIEENRRSDAHKKVLTELFYRSKGWLSETAQNEKGWIGEYEDIFAERDKVARQLEDFYKQQRAVEVKINDLRDTDIQQLRETERHYISQKERFHATLVRAQTERRRLESQRDADVTRRDKLLKEQDKSRKILAELEATSDILTVLRNTYRKITTDELDKVSVRMNELFLEMIGADPDQGAIIKRAEISREFDILVYGPGNRTLNPDRDLNGASRRALTLSFILALTDVSEVEAPNIIDTPLGMMSGFVKRSVLKTAIKESSQLCLFLTRSEIEGCEDIIDEWADMVITLTNPAHFPRMLVHQPPTDQMNILRCECNHHRECHICERREDIYEKPIIRAIAG
jgi:DNA sulfur modification protein DndD